MKYIEGFMDYTMDRDKLSRSASLTGCTAAPGADPPDLCEKRRRGLRARR